MGELDACPYLRTVFLMTLDDDIFATDTKSSELQESLRFVESKRRSLPPRAPRGNCSPTMLLLLLLLLLVQSTASAPRQSQRGVLHHFAI